MNQDVEYNEEACLWVVRQAIKACFQRPNFVYKNFSMNSILSRLEFATKNNRLLEMYCDAVGIESTKIRREMIEKNIEYLYEINYKKRKNIKLVEVNKVKKWIIK